MLDTHKAFYQSKTFWFNALTIVVAVAMYFGFGEFRPSAETVELGAVLVAVINIALRFGTQLAIR